MPKISIVLPTIEEESVFKLIEDLRKELGKDIEIVIVDKSRCVPQEAKQTGALVIMQKDSGVENAIMQGLRSAHGEILASIDADGTHDISGIFEGSSS